MPTQPVARLLRMRGLSVAMRTQPRCIVALANRAGPPQMPSSARFGTRTRPVVSFISSPKSTPSPHRTYISKRTENWLRREAKLLVRYAFISWAGILSVFVIYYFYIEEKVEREYPTPHEWDWMDRKLLRDAHKWTDPEYRPVSWIMSFQCARQLCLNLEDPSKKGGVIPFIHDHEDANDDLPREFIPQDISERSEEWRRGYFECIMLAARASGLVDGYLKEKDTPRSRVWAPQFVLGPSNPRPQPIPQGSPPAPREEDCEVAFPPAERYYLKILATKGFSSSQRVEAALEYANFLDNKRHGAGSDALYDFALAEAAQGLDQSRLPYNPKTLVLKDDGPLPSKNILDVITALANHKARSGDISGALPIYVSLLKSRRSLPSAPPKDASTAQPRLPFPQNVIRFFQEPDYPPPPPDGTRPPWRSPEERCQEASLNLYIGEILFAKSSHDEGIAWTREGVDLAEEQLRGMSADTSMKKSASAPRDRCRECLKTGIDNWGVMVQQLIRQASLESQSQNRHGVLSFWSNGSAGAAAQDRWEAEAAVVEERANRTKDLVEDTKPTKKQSAMKYVKA